MWNLWHMHVPKITGTSTILCTNHKERRLIQPAAKHTTEKFWWLACNQTERQSNRKYWVDNKPLYVSPSSSVSVPDSGITMLSVNSELKVINQWYVHIHQNYLQLKSRKCVRQYGKRNKHRFLCSSLIFWVSSIITTDALQ